MPAAAYVAAVALGALAASIATVSSHASTETEWIAFALLLPLSALAPLFRVAISHNYSLHTAPAFLVAGVLVLPPALVLALVVAVHASPLIRERYPWYIHVFNVGNSVLNALAAWVVVDAIGQGSELRFALSGLAATTVFVLSNHTLLAIMLRLGRGHSVKESGLFSPAALGIGLVLAGLGVALGAFAEFNPWLLPALVAPLLLAHRSFTTIALLRESEERFRTMFQSAPTPMLLLSLDGTIVAANRSTHTTLGYGENELIGVSTEDLRHPDEAEEGGQVFAELARGELETFRKEARYLAKDGRLVVTHLAAALVRDADGKPNYVIGMAEDVTGHRELEEQLRQSQKLEAIGRLAGGVAHDFNNMLTAIGGYTTFALEHAEEGSTLRSDLDEVRKATDRAALLTRQLLAFSRKQVLKPERLDVNAIVLELQTMLRPLIGEDVTLATQLEPSLGSVEADPGQLHQVVVNLVVNARDAMPDGGHVTILTANAVIEAEDDTLEPGRYVTLTVRDTGEGIDESTLGQIFEPFFTTKADGKGTGLGLATVYGIVKQSGGYIEVESEVGVGSAFTIYLHCADAVPPPPIEPVRTVAAAAASDVARTAETTTVLVVEDEDTIRGLVDQVLRGEGYAVLLAADGAEATELAGSHRVDVLLTDLTMPGIGGHELADRLRAASPELKVLYMSGFAEGGDFSATALPPATGFLDKPFTFAELRERVRELIDAPLV